MTQDNQTPTVRRRTIAQGAAWAVPVITVGAAAPAMAASPPNEECQPVLTVQPGSYKCCNTATKNMKVVLMITDANNCGIPAELPINILDVLLANGQDPGTLVWADSEGNILDGPPSVVLGDTFTVYLQGTHSCTVNLLVQTEQYGLVAVQSDNIPGGNTAGDCVPLAS
jgi:hypothetical protein